VAGGDYTVKVEGLSEAVRALDAVDRKAKLTILKGLREAAAPIAVDIRRDLSKYNDMSLGTIRPSAGVRGVYIRQYAKRVTGERPDFGALQMRRGFLPEAYKHEGDLAAAADRALAELIYREGLQ
jgi:hypothetical protein